VSGNASRNMTHSERIRANAIFSYTLGLDLVDEFGRKSRFWFQSAEDRYAFAALFNALHTHGHTSYAVIVEE
jgi:hypothetical protein